MERMMLWKLFLETGAPEVYLAYCQKNENAAL